MNFLQQKSLDLTHRLTHSLPSSYPALSNKILLDGRSLGRGAGSFQKIILYPLSGNDDAFTFIIY